MAASILDRGIFGFLMGLFSNRGRRVSKRPCGTLRKVFGTLAGKMSGELGKERSESVAAKPMGGGLQVVAARNVARVLLRLNCT
jgi:hypothetical protein